MSSAFKRVLSLVGLLLGIGLLYLFAVWRADAALDAALLQPFRQPLLAGLPLAGAALVLYLHVACGLFPSEAGIRFFNWAVFLLSLCAPVCWLILVHMWQSGLPRAWLLALVVLGAGEGLMGLVCLIWAWCQRARALRLLIPASLCQLAGVALFGGCLALGWGAEVALRYCEICGALIPAKEARLASSAKEFICPRCFESRKALVQSGSDASMQMQGAATLPKDTGNVRFNCLGCKRQLKRKRVALMRRFRCPQCDLEQNLFPDGHVESLDQQPDPDDPHGFANQSVDASEVGEYFNEDDLKLDAEDELAAEQEEEADEPAETPASGSSGRTARSPSSKRITAPRRRKDSSGSGRRKARVASSPKADDEPAHESDAAHAEEAASDAPGRRWLRVLLLVLVLLPPLLAGVLLAGSLKPDGFARQGGLGRFVESSTQKVEQGLHKLAGEGWLNAPTAASGADTLGVGDAE